MSALGRALARVQTWLLGLSGWRAGLVAALAGAAGVLGHAPFFAWPVFAIAIMVLFVLLDATAAEGFGLVRGLKAAAWRSWAFAFGYFLVGMSWVGNAFLVDAERFAMLLPVAVTALPAGLGLFWVLGGLAFRALYQPGAGRVLVFAAVFGLVELARGHWFTGLPWNLPAYVWQPGGWISQTGALVGAYGVSTLTLFVFAAPLALGSRGGRLVVGLAAGALVAGLGYGGQRLAHAGPVGATTPATAPVIAAGQGGFSQREVWEPGGRQRIVDGYLALLADPAARRADVVVWPEGAMPVLLLEETDVTDRIDAELGNRVLVIGALRRDLRPDPDEGQEEIYFNSVLALSRRSGALSVDGLYDKHHLVPFGEYLPLARLFGALGLESLVSVGGGFEPGPAPGLLSVPGLAPADARICYEIIFPSYNDTSNRAAGWLVNVSVDAWYGEGLGPDQHYAQARWRAIETGLPVVRAASGGWSAIIDPYGRAVAEHRRGAGHAIARLPNRTHTVFTTRILPLSVIVIHLVVLIVGLLVGNRLWRLTRGAH